MSFLDDDEDEMLGRLHLDDDTIESFFSGCRPATEDLRSLAHFAEDVQLVVDRPVPAPTVALAAILAKGFSTENGDLSATTASNVPGPAPQAAGLPKWRKKRMVPQLLAGIAKLSLAAKAGFAVTLAAASVTAAGAAGVLPPAAQDAVANAVAAVSPFEFPSQANEKADFGKTVSDDAKDGGVDGKDLSDSIKNDHAGVADDAGSQAKTGLDEANKTPAANHTPASVPAGPATADQYKPTDVPAGQPAATPTGASQDVAPEQPATSPAPAAGTAPSGQPESTPSGQPQSTPSGRP